MSTSTVCLRSLAALTIVALLALTPACGGGGGGGGGGGPTQPPPPQTGITFTPSGAAGTNSISLLRQGQGATTLTLQVQANGVTDLYGASFDLSFPSAALTYTGFTEGALLSGTGGAVATSVQVTESPSGNLVVGISRLGAVGGVSGSGTLLTLNFSAVANGSGAMSFTGAQAFSPNAPIGSVQFVGGSVQVIQ